MGTLITKLCHLSFLCLSIGWVSGFVQEFELYAGENCEGPFTPFEAKKPDLSNLEEVVTNSKSYSWKGLWFFYGQVDYDEQLNFQMSTSPDAITCKNESLKGMQSIRFMGLPDSSQSAISFYEGTESTMTGGTEVVVTTDLRDIGFIPQWAVVTGGGRWTMYEDVDFNGNSTCVGGRSFYFDYFSIRFGRSVRLGCF